MDFTGILSGLLNGIANYLGIARDIGNRKNAPDIKGNVIAKDDAAAADAIQKDVAGAAKGDAKSLEDIRDEAAE